MSKDVVGYMLGKEKHSYLNQASNIWKLPDTSVGIEIELEKVGIRNVPNILPLELQRYWEWHEDQSLHDQGVEFTFKGPMFGRDVEEAVRGILDFSQKHTKWTSSLRTGLHVHIDVRDLTRYQLLGFLAYYNIFEPAIYGWVGDNRDINNFCLPWYKANQALDDASLILSGMRNFSENLIDRQELLSYCNQFHRYAGLNLKSLAELGFH